MILKNGLIFSVSLAKQLVYGGIAKFMQKLQGGYTYYFNVKNSRTGSLFQGTFKSHLMNSENYFNKILGYTNKNYQVHNIPKNKMDLIFASDFEYENNNFKIVSKKEGKRILEIFNGSKNFQNSFSFFFGNNLKIIIFILEVASENKIHFIFWNIVNLIVFICIPKNFIKIIFTIHEM